MKMNSVTVRDASANGEAFTHNVDKQKHKYKKIVKKTYIIFLEIIIYYQELKMNFEKFYCILKKFVNITKGILLRKSQIVNISDEYI